ncbi:hypothetical protein NM688_g3966 [Phlebia brevispora]|uniref:Uncharacterized protein n=1 Tax=Phlebia brevispora TaxID=194682 RepID=A0ACC1T494_9APHY|nr:hypothetical protein NM688_g3966 [Phlebia brevispora]
MLIRGFKKSRLSRDGPLLGYVVLTFILSTILIGTGMQFTMQAFVNDRNFPGGPSAYEVVEFSIPIDATANDALVISTYLSDALLMWRCTVMFKNSSIPEWITISIALLFWFTEFILGVLFLVQISANSIFGVANFTLGFWCFSLTLNVLATIVIVGRLFIYRRRLANVLGSGYITQYTGVMAMVVESELLYTAFMILYIVPFVLNNPIENVFVQPPSLIQAIAALMIVYRVASGKGWTKDTYAQMTTTRAQGSTIQLSNLSTLRATGSTTFADEVKSTGTGIQVTQEVYMTKESTGSV